MLKFFRIWIVWAKYKDVFSDSPIVRNKFKYCVVTFIAGFSNVAHH